MENPDVKEESAGCLRFGFPFFISLIGVILYFAKKSDKFDSSGYLYDAAGTGFVIGLILRIATGAIH